MHTSHGACGEFTVTVGGLLQLAGVVSQGKGVGLAAALGVAKFEACVKSDGSVNTRHTNNKSKNVMGRNVFVGRDLMSGSFYDESISKLSRDAVGTHKTFAMTTKDYEHLGAVLAMLHLKNLPSFLLPSLF